jgi:hypothetical protein
MINDQKTVPTVAVFVVDAISQRKTGQELRLPTNMASKLAASAVAVSVFKHQLADGGGNEYDYRFNYEGRLLNPDETLEQAAVKPGSTLHLSYIPTSAGFEQ